MDLMTESVFPIMRVEGTIFVGISSPSEHGNFFNLLMDSKDKRTGEDIFSVLRQTTICPKCVSVSNSKCKHLLYLMPAWQNPALNELVDQLYDVLDCGDTKQNELYGLVNKYSGGMVSNAALKHIESQMPFNWSDHMDNKPQFVFVGHDPNGDGQCHMGLTAVTFIDGQIIVRIYSISPRS